MASRKVLHQRMRETAATVLLDGEELLASAYCHTWPGWGSIALTGAIVNRMQGKMRPHFALATNRRLILMPTWRERPDPKHDILSWDTTELKVEAAQRAITGRRLSLKTPSGQIRLNFDFGWGRECEALVAAISGGR